MTTPPDHPTPEREAACWLTQLRKPDLSREQFLRFLAWYQAPENHAALQELLRDSPEDESWER